MLSSLPVLGYHRPLSDKQAILVLRGLKSPRETRLKQSSWALYSRLLTYVRPLWKPFSLSVLGFLLYAGASTWVADALRRMIDGIQHPSTEFRYLMPLIFIAIFLVRGIGTFLGTYFMDYVGGKVVFRLRVDVFDNMIRLPNRFFDHNSSGHLLSHMTYQVERVTSAATDALTTVLREGLTVVGLTFFLFYTNWRLTLVFLCVTPLIGVVVGYAGRRIRKLSHRIQDAVGDVTHVASEVLSGNRVVRSHGAEEYELRRFTRVSENTRRQNLKETTTSAIAGPLIQTMVALAMAFMVWLALIPNLMGNITPGQFTAFILAASMLIKPIKSLTEINGKIQKGLAAAESIFGILDAPKEPDEGTHAPERVSGRVQFEHVSLKYSDDGSDALSDINLDIKPGEMVALVGRSGSGKTSLVSMLPRFYAPYKGRILLDGVDVCDYSLKALRRQISLVSQQVTLFNTSIASNIAYGDEQPSRERVIKAARAAYAAEFIERLPEGFDTLIGDNGVMLSGGQRQRLAIARAIYRNSQVLVLDEATSALDTESERYIQNALEDVRHDRTTLVIAHRLSTIENADRIAVFDHGKLIELGTHAELIEKEGAYAALHRIQFSDEKEDA